MSRLTTIALLVGAFTTASIAAGAQQPTPKINSTTIQPTSATSGQQMFTTYCAVCHGASGIGNGPAAAALKVPPANLTLLSQNNGGSFPSNHVTSVLKFGTAIPAHGSAEMPIWGDEMRTLNPTQVDDSLIRLRILNLTNYLKQMQK
jgi:mono/diheme cytochrome c family protein